MLKKKVMAICGSTKSASLNLSLIHAISKMYADELEMSVYAMIASLPHFNPDMDNASPPREVTAFRQQIKEADGVLICTPEYAMGVPGTLKNAIDWTVSSCEFSHKPVALITASSQGQKGHQSLLETLKIIESKMTDETQLVISFIKTKVNTTNEIKDEATKIEVSKTVGAFLRLME